jgi:hypothetical protein
MRIFMLLSVIAALAFGCRTTQQASEPIQAIYIKHGTSFGHCIGYCTKEESYQEFSMTASQFNRDSTNFPRKQFRTDLSDGEFSRIIAAIDWKKWDKLPTVIGCPDCADGGAEYVEIKTQKGTKRVTFDAGSDPEGLENLLAILRVKRDEMESPKE